MRGFEPSFVLGGALVLGLAGSPAACSARSHGSCAMECQPSVRMDLVLEAGADQVLAGTSLLCVNDDCAPLDWSPVSSGTIEHRGQSTTGGATLQALSPTHSLLSAGFGGMPWDSGTRFRVALLDSAGQPRADFTRRVHGGSDDCAGCTHGELRIEPGAPSEATCTSAPCAAGVFVDAVIAVPLAQMSGAELELCHNQLCTRAVVGSWSEAAPMGGGMRALEGDLPGTLEVYADGDRFDVKAHIPLAGALLAPADVGRLTIAATDGTVIATGTRVGFEQTQPNGAECTGPVGCRRILITPD